MDSIKDMQIEMAVLQHQVNDLEDQLKSIVRCKDCKHSIPDREDGKIVGYECDFLYDSYWDADDFCSRAEIGNKTT